MANWERLHRETLKAVIAGIIAGVASRSVSVDFSGGLMDYAIVMLLYWMAVTAFWVVERYYGKPGNSKSSGEKESESTPYQDIPYAS